MNREILPHAMQLDKIIVLLYLFISFRYGYCSYL